jgi:predicted pyridoxine 5'-phosphate oxidase superfamily flavin-nucleotide-binding protein
MVTVRRSRPSPADPVQVGLGLRLGARQRARVGVRVRGRVGVRLRVRVRVRVRVTRAGRVTPHSTAAARRAGVGHEPAPIGDGCGFEADEAWVDAVVGS